MKRAAAGLLSLILVLFCAVFPADYRSLQVCAEVSVQAEPDLSEEAVRNAMLALKKKYPEGTRYTNDDFYAWKGGIFSGGYGCAGFAFMLSDAAFGSLPARYYSDYSNIRVGDILRMNNNTHSVIVLEVRRKEIVIAEGNYNSSVHWGRVISMDAVNDGTTTYGMTRYPKSEQQTGDLDGDSDITSADAQIVLNAYVQRLAQIENTLTADQRKAADINGDGLISAEDAQLILRFYAENTLAKHDVSWQELLRG